MLCYTMLCYTTLYYNTDTLIVSSFGQKRLLNALNLKLNVKDNPILYCNILYCTILSHYYTIQ